MSHNQNNNRQWKVLCWNIRGINSQAKWSAIRSKINETNYDIVCLQETKKDFFDQAYIKKLCHAQFDYFDYIPSQGASGGSIVIWKSSRFVGRVIFQNEFAMNIEFSSVHSGATWVLTNIYALCSSEGRQNFLSWLNDIDMSDDCDWLLVGDFNLIQRPSD
jgi:exonuclease III